MSKEFPVLAPLPPLIRKPTTVADLVAALQALPNQDAVLVKTYTKEPLHVEVRGGFPVDDWAVIEIKEG